MAKRTKRPVRRDVTLANEKFIDDPLINNRPTGFNSDYQFVIRDLRRVGILAGSFIVILVALSFLLH
jgi:hypothetical protein